MPISPINTFTLTKTQPRVESLAPSRERPTRRQTVPGLNDSLIAEQIGEVSPHPPRQGVNGLPPVALGLHNGRGNVSRAQRLLCPPQSVGNEPVQLAVAEQLELTACGVRAITPPDREISLSLVSPIAA